MSTRSAALAVGEAPVRLVFCAPDDGSRVFYDVLSRDLGVPAPWIQIARDEHGKPRVAWPPTELRFSVSYTAGVTLVALTRGVEVGVDVEDLERDVTGWALWQQVLTTAEVARLPQPKSNRNAALLRLWVAKEAILKASGLGLGLDPRRVELDADGRVVSLPVSLGDPAMWSVAWCYVEGAVAAVACATPHLQIDVDLQALAHRPKLLSVTHGRR